MKTKMTAYSNLKTNFANSERKKTYDWLIWCRALFFLSVTFFLLFFFSSFLLSVETSWFAVWLRLWRRRTLSLILSSWPLFWSLCKSSFSVNFFIIIITALWDAQYWFPLPSSFVKDWLTSYEKLADMVVPRSSEYFYFYFFFFFWIN
jgi:hypothetical protein